MNQHGEQSTKPRPAWPVTKYEIDLSTYPRLEDVRPHPVKGGLAAAGILALGIGLVAPLMTPYTLEAALLYALPLLSMAAIAAVGAYFAFAPVLRNLWVRQCVIWWEENHEAILSEDSVALLNSGGGAALTKILVNDEWKVAELRITVEESSSAPRTATALIVH